MSKFDFKSAVKRNKNLRFGGYATIVTIVVLVVLVVVNVLFQQLKITVDLTPNRLYSVGDKTTEILNGLTQDVNIYGIYKPGSDESGSYNPQVKRFVMNYVDNSSRLHYTQIDPLSNPTFTKQFLSEATDSIADGTIIVQAADSKSFKILPLSDFYSVTQNQQTGQSEVTAFAAEEALTSAVQYVTSENNPVILQLTGHSEGELDSTMTSYLKKSNFDVSSLDLIRPAEGEDSVSLEANNYTIVMVNNPKSDLTDKEYEILLDYMEKGGRMMVLVESDLPELPNFEKLLTRFGIGVERGSVVETSARNYYMYPNLVIPNYGEHDITSDMAGSSNYMLMLNPASLTVSENRNRSTTITPLMTSSDDAIIKGDPESTVAAFEEGDTKGPFNLGLVAEEQKSLDNTVVTSKMVVVGSASCFAKNSGTMLQGNYNMFINICDYLQDEVNSLYISPKSIVEGTMPVSMQTFITGGVIFVILVPLAVLACGLVVYLRRKHL